MMLGPGGAVDVARSAGLGPHSARESNRGVDLQEIQEVIDGLVEQVALVGCDGTILAVNDCWRRQVQRQSRTGLHISRDYIAFLECLIESGDEGVKPILKAFRDIASGSRGAFRHLYKGSGCFEGYDFNIVVAALTIHGTRHVLVSVHDVTELVSLKLQRRRIVSQLLRAQEAERRRMARELHDSTSQMLVSLRFDLSRLGRGNLEPEAASRIDECQKTLQEIQREIRTFSFVAHPPSLTGNSLAVALQDLASGFAKRSGLEIDVEVSDTGEASASVEAAIYRLSQEALANIHRHAGATRATIRLVGRKGCLHLVIGDDGVGINAAQSRTGKSIGVGVMGMRERVLELGGRISIQRAVHGTVLTVSIPRHKRTVLAPFIGVRDSRFQP
jgi:two-component system, NarL family, sensor kinase